MKDKLDLSVGDFSKRYVEPAQRELAIDTLKAQLAEARRLLSAALHTIEFLATEDPAAPRKDMLRWVKDARALIRRA